MSSDSNNNFGFVIEEIFELGHTRKSQCFDTWIISTSAYYKNLGSRARLFKTLDTRQSKIHQLSIFKIHKNNHWNLPRAFQHLDVWSETPSEFWQCFDLICTNCTNLSDSRAQFFYIPGCQKFFPFFHQNFHLNLQKSRCRNAKRFSNCRPRQLPRQSSTASCKTLERLLTKVRHM